jgi:hypothetical protein
MTVARIGIGVGCTERIAHRQTFDPRGDQRAGNIELAMDREVTHENDVWA